MKNIYCPFCGNDVTKETETEIGIICPTCHSDFWKSETIENNEIHLYTYSKDYNMMIKQF